MKAVVVILTLVSCHVFAEEWAAKNKDEVNIAKDQCKRETNVPLLNIIKRINDELTQKFLVCVFQKLDILNSGQGFYPDRLAKQFTSDLEYEIREKIAQLCVSKYYKAIDNVDMSGYETFECYFKNKNNPYFYI